MIAHILLNWRGTFQTIRLKFPRRYDLVDKLLESLLVEQEKFGDFEVESVPNRILKKILR